MMSLLYMTDNKQTEPSDEELAQVWRQVSGRETLRPDSVAMKFARALLSRYAAPQASAKSEDVKLPPLPDAAMITYEFPDGAYDSELMIEYGRACYEAGLSYYQQRDRGVNDQTKHLHSGAVEVCPECDIAGCRHIRARADLATRPCDGSC